MSIRQQPAAHCIDNVLMTFDRFVNIFIVSSSARTPDGVVSVNYSRTITANGIRRDHLSGPKVDNRSHVRTGNHLEWKWQSPCI